MIRFVPFHAEDLLAIVPQHDQLDETELARLDIGRIAERELSFSVFVGSECICCSGIIPMHAQRAFVWAYLSRYARRHMLPLTRFSRRVFDEYPARRLEMTIAPEFRMAKRWAEMLGFTYEASLEAYDELGREMLMYKRIRR